MSTPTSLYLPPQITPFTPPADVDCSVSVYCKYLTYEVYTMFDHELSGLGCQGVNVIGPGMLAYETRCFPDGYFTIFDNLYEEIRQIPGTPTEGPGSSTLAYPGTACLSGWTTACTTTLTNNGGAYPQAWCCPPGSWTCAANEHTGLDTVQLIPGRYCASVLTGATDIYMTWDPPFTAQGGSEYYTWPVEVTSEPSEYAATVYHRVFPLLLTANTFDAAAMPTTLDSNIAASDNAIVGPADDASVAALSKGAIAGIAIGAAVFVLGLGAVGVYVLFVRRRQNKNNLAGGSSSGADSPPDGHVSGDKSELGGNPVAEMEAQNSGHGSGTISPLSPNPAGSNGMFPSPDSRHRSLFEMSA
ncbi:hypothetical protein GGR54DRAFT_11371 [Hypoxylon sp. NC1633]|nr:hypothetical protein GGR54DRAFT_11371 [Hypoxylon sp. NC1633]